MLLILTDFMIGIGVIESATFRGHSATYRGKSTTCFHGKSATFHGLKYDGCKMVPKDCL